MTHSIPKGVRKGAWTDEEDLLLRKCIQKYGGGNWHQVPSRAGLNRCRKSCRLRWLNYLHPNIKRGDFSLDEIDLIIRMHKLLGNRWSLISGRLPGRTANDIKNLWNTHLHKRFPTQRENKVTKTLVTKPQPRTFPRTSQWLRRNKVSIDITPNQKLNNNTEDEVQEQDTTWLESILLDKDEGRERTFYYGSGQHLQTSDFCVDVVESKERDSSSRTTNFNDMYFDINAWDLLVAEQEQLM